MKSILETIVNPMIRTPYEGVQRSTSLGTYTLLERLALSKCASNLECAAWCIISNLAQVP